MLRAKRISFHVLRSDQLNLMTILPSNDTAFYLSFEVILPKWKEIVRENVSAKQYKMFTLEATKSQQLQQQYKSRNNCV